MDAQEEDGRSSIDELSERSYEKGRGELRRKIQMNGRRVHTVYTLRKRNKIKTMIMILNL